MANRERGKLRKLDWQVWEQEPDKQSSDPSPPHLPFRNNLFAESTHYPLSLTQLKCYISALGEEACQSLDRPVGWKVWIFMGFNIYGVQYLCHIPKMSVPAALAILQHLDSPQLDFFVYPRWIRMKRKDSGECYALLLSKPQISLILQDEPKPYCLTPDSSGTPLTQVAI